MDINAVDAIGTDSVTVQDRSFFPNAVRVISLTDLVIQVGQRVGMERHLRRLRIIGHGGPGHQGLGDSFHRTNIFDSSPSISFNWMLMANLADYFTADGWLELHGCNVAEGVEGKLYLSRLASLLNVPVRAGTQVQYGGSLRNDLRLWGPWREARPMPGGGISFHVYTGAEPRRRERRVVRPNRPAS